MQDEVRTVAFAGEGGSYAEEASSRLFPDAEPLACVDFEEAATGTWNGRAQRAVLPVENSLAGFVPETLGLLEEGRLAIVGEAVLHIPHLLVGVPGSTLGGIRTVHSHPMALAQCRRSLDPKIQRVGAPTTSEAARHVAELGDLTVAAIASPTAARQHNLVVLADDVSDHPENYTRFVAVAPFQRLDAGAAGDWRTALRIITRHEPGALHDAIEPFRYHRVQMTSLHSRPIMGQPWRYQFHLEIDGHRASERVRRALNDLDERVALLETFGSYPVWRDPHVME
jgi:prephenate dehydratase